MLFLNDINDLNDKNKDKVLKQSYNSEELLDIWLSEGAGQIETGVNGQIYYKKANEGIFGEIKIPIKSLNGNEIESITYDSYKSMLSFLESFQPIKLVRVWNYVPSILAETYDSQGTDVYRCFNYGRYRAFEDFYDSSIEDWNIPAASAVGTSLNELRIEFFASDTDCILLENKEQIPSYKYSNKYGKLPPLFSRGAIYRFKSETLLFTAGTASVIKEQTVHIGDVYNQILQSIQNLRILISQFNLKSYGIQYGFGLEDLEYLRIYYKYEKDRDFIEKMIKKFVEPECKLSFMRADICRNDLLVEIEGVFRKKGEYGDDSKEKYFIEDNKIRVESLEVPIVEHCNLKCRDCCTSSPYNDKKLLDVEEIKGVYKFLSENFRTDVFKVIGGEPLLHPNLLEIIDIAKEFGFSNTIRVVSNGLLLYKMADDLWEKIDRLTISNYCSAPVPEEHLKLIYKKAQEFGVALNVKYVDQFNRVLILRPHKDTEKINSIYKDCWIRHRCLMVRDGIFYKCARAAYMDSLFKKMKVQKTDEDPESFSKVDGIPIDDLDFLQKAVKYLNSKVPLVSCKYCLGVSGELIPNQQLTKKEIDDCEIGFYL